MTRVIEAIMKRSVLLISSLAIILAWGGISAFQMQRDYLPPISNPTLMISLHAPDMPADRIKAAVTEPIEQSIRKVNGLQTLETNSFDDGLLMSLYFPVQYDMTRAENDVNLLLQQVRLPANLDRPVVERVSTSSFPIMRLSLTSPSGEADEQSLRTTIQAQVAGELQKLPGVSGVRVTGAGQDGYQVTIRMADLHQAGLTIADVKRALGGGIDTPDVQGKITSSEVSFPLTVTGGCRSEQDLARLPIHAPGGRKVALSEIADVSRSIVDVQTIARTDGQPSVVIDVLKSPSANITAVSDLIRGRIQDIPALREHGVALSVLLDQGAMVGSALQGLLREGLLGCLLSMACVFLFFRNARSTALIALSLPVCFLATTGLLKTMGISLNLLTVSGLIAAMGRVIDDSIVILDNVYRRARETGSRMNAGLIAEAVREMLPAIVASTATTVAVYIPISLAGGMIGAAFSGFAWSVVIALLTSLLVAMFVVPAFYHLWRHGQRTERAVSLDSFWKPVLRWSVPRRGRITAAFVVLFALSVTGAAFLPINFLPAAKSGQINVQLEFPQDTPLAQMDAAVKRMEQTLKSDEDVASFSSVLGSTFTPQFDDVFDAGGGWIQSGTIANIAVSVQKKADVDAVTADLTQRLTGLAGGAVCTVTNQNIAGDDSQLKINFSGADALTLENAARMARSSLMNVQGLSVAGAADEKEDAVPRHRLTLNREALTQSGVSPEAVYDRVGAYLADGTRIDMKAGGQVIPFELRTDLAARSGQSGYVSDPVTDILTQLGQETFAGTDGRTYRLDQLASLAPLTGQSVIQEADGKPFASVAANITSRDVEGVSRDVHRLLDKMALPAGVHFTMNGITAQVNQMMIEAGIALAVSVLLILIIISLAFRSWRAPVTVIACIPLAFIGSIVGMLACGLEWNLASLVGLLMLSGIVVTNGIVLVDKIERLLAQGMSPTEAILEGTVTRVRPVLMTAVTTVLTLLPLCVLGSGDAIVSQTLGIVVVGGMISSTLISLLVIPILYHAILGRTRAAQAKMRAMRPATIAR
ncbi:Multidrug efflux pump subunit AcrB [Paenibacillus sp. UNC496MF]|uniref:efflux RND transporter permease subunit n=1 Tax=Paenibacillus sp. UNC496MF TaxID=1502753 RepID=UPI0008F1F74A|nr:efflux RND transporter permease subunit [Paenibacillus sp. UNC496MF]SFJ12260.1 Multidrug efflux pump subunit AcrB [Paenibacillus sp. UNC496MF]